MNQEDSMMIDRFCESNHWNYKKNKNKRMIRKSFDYCEKKFGSNVSRLLTSISGIFESFGDYLL